MKFFIICLLALTTTLGTRVQVPLSLEVFSRSKKKNTTEKTIIPTITSISRQTIVTNCEKCALIIVISEFRFQF